MPVLKIGRIVKLWTSIAASDPAVTIAYISHNTACLMDLLDRHDAPPARRQQLCRVHRSAYLEVIDRDHRLH